MIITIAGNLGSGKSTVGKMLAKELGYRFFSTGDLMGDIALEKGISLLELSKLAEQSDEVDKLLDARQIEFGKKEKNAVIDSRLGWHFIPQATKIFLTVDPLEAAKRIFNDKREEEKENVDIESTRQNIITRKESERLRYQKYYNLVCDDPKNFDIVVDSTEIPAEKVFEKVLKEIQQRRED